MAHRGATATDDVRFTVLKTVASTPGTEDGYTINFREETIDIESGYEANTENDGTGAAIIDGSNIVPDTTIYIRKAGDNNHEPSEWVAVTLPSRPDAPHGFVVVNETFAGEKDGKITGLDSSKVYYYKQLEDPSWKTVENLGEITGLEAGTYLVRMSEVDNTNFVSGAAIYVIAPSIKPQISFTANAMAVIVSGLNNDALLVVAKYEDGQMKECVLIEVTDNES